MVEPRKNTHDSTRHAKQNSKGLHKSNSPRVLKSSSSDLDWLNETIQPSSSKSQLVSSFTWLSIGILGMASLLGIFLANYFNPVQMVQSSSTQPLNNDIHPDTHLGHHSTLNMTLVSSTDPTTSVQSVFHAINNSEQPRGFTFSHVVLPKDSTFKSILDLLPPFLPTVYSDSDPIVPYVPDIKKPLYRHSAVASAMDELAKRHKSLAKDQFIQLLNQEQPSPVYSYSTFDIAFLRQWKKNLGGIVKLFPKSLAMRPKCQIGSAGVKTRPSYETMDGTFLYQVEGTQVVRLKLLSRSMQRFPSSHPLSSYVAESMEAESESESESDFDVDLNSSSGNFTFPLDFPTTVVVQVKAGDLVYIPPLWAWSSVLKTTSVAVISPVETAVKNLVPNSLRFFLQKIPGRWTESQRQNVVALYMNGLLQNPLIKPSLALTLVSSSVEKVGETEPHSSQPVVEEADMVKDVIIEEVDEVKDVILQDDSLPNSLSQLAHEEVSQAEFVRRFAAFFLRTKYAQDLREKADIDHSGQKICNSNANLSVPFEVSDHHLKSLHLMGFIDPEHIQGPENPGTIDSEYIYRHVLTDIGKTSGFFSPIIARHNNSRFGQFMAQFYIGTYMLCYDIFNCRTFIFFWYQNHFSLSVYFTVCLFLFYLFVCCFAISPIYRRICGCSHALESNG